MGLLATSLEPRVYRLDGIFVPHSHYSIRAVRMGFETPQGFQGSSHDLRRGFAADPPCGDYALTRKIDPVPGGVGGAVKGVGDPGRTAAVSATEYRRS